MKDGCQPKSRVRVFVSIIVLCFLYPSLANSQTPQAASPENVPAVTSTENSECPLYQISAEYLGDIYQGGGTISGNTQTGIADPIYVKGEYSLDCVTAEVAKAVALCTSEPVRKHLATLPYGPTLIDDCIVAGYFLGNPALTGGAKTAWTPASLKNPKGENNSKPAICYLADGEGCSWAGGNFYLDAQCNSVMGPSPEDLAKVCNLGYFEWVSSPISLVWEKGAEIDDNIAFVEFPLDPAKSGKSYAWKASSKTPLLVYDPEHKGDIRSATQLFGNWTFGGKRLASARESVLPTSLVVAEQQWGNGFEALATLDANGDGKISGAELTPIGLWFDKNQDGISQEGEVKAATDLGITGFFVTPDRKDEATRNIFANSGYERMVDGSLVRGSLVDWYGEEGDSKYELLSKYSLQTSLCTNNSSASFESPSAVGSPGKADVGAGLGGIWLWKMEGDRGNNAPQGYLSLKDTGDGKIIGHTIGAMQFGEKSKQASSMVNIFMLEGKKSSDSLGRLNLEFKIDSGQGVASKAELSSDGSLLRGETSSQTMHNGKSTTLHYKWTAEKKYAEL
jgi:hypothetical protein